jgi:hypothetical protein
MKSCFLSCFSFMSLLAGSAYAGTINVDFTKDTGTVNSRAFSMDSTEYGSPHDIVHDQTVYNLIAALHLDAMRIDLQNGSDPQLGAGGTSGPGDPWVQAIDKTGAKPIIRLHTIGEDDNGTDSGGSAADAQAMVSRYTANYAAHGLSKPVQYYIIGNETNANDSSGSNFIAFAPGMRSASGGVTIYIGGPAWGWYDEGTMTTYHNNTKSTAGGPDFLDYHQYGNGGNTTMSAAQLLQELIGGGSGGDVQQYGTVSYQAEMAKLHADTGLPIECGEWNLTWGSDPAQGQPFNAIWGASVIGNIVKAGGISMEYGDSSGSLMGVVSQNDTPMPLYYAYYMFTGGILFQHFGTNMVLTSVTGDTTVNVQGSNVVQNDTLEVFASNNPKNIVVINKDPNNTQTGTINLTGYDSGTMNAWQTMGSGLPTHIATNVAITGGTFTYSLPPYSVTTFVLGN